MTMWATVKEGAQGVAWEWIILPTVGAGIGWITNLVAIRLLFRPKAPVRIGRGLFVQGVLPRRQADIARVVGATVERDLLPIDELLETLNISAYERDVVDAVSSYVDRRLEANLPQTLPSQIRKWVATYVKRIVEREAGDVVRDVTMRVRERVQEDVKIGQVVEEKVNQLDTDELERIVVRVAGTELRAIELLGAVLGFVIGLIQAMLLTWL